MRFHELTEAFDKVQPYQWHDRSNEDFKILQAEFQIDDGLFVVQFLFAYHSPGAPWKISFVRNGDLDISGTGNAGTVFATVMQATRDFIAHIDPRAITFLAKNDEASRIKLYPRLVAMLQREFPQYALKPETTTRHFTTFELERPRKPFVATQRPKEEIPPVSDEDMERMLADLEQELGRHA